MTTTDCTPTCNKAGEHTPALHGCVMAPAEEAVSHDDLVTLTAYMAWRRYRADDIAHAVEKPWNYADLLDEAREALRTEEWSGSCR